jgi:RNase P subunit RPR2
MEQTKKFQVKVESFICKKCRTVVEGSGCTNHCPNCLWSRHVDIYPGDRAEKCHGMMKPVRIEKEGELLYIIHKCEDCGFERRNKKSPDDNFEEILKLI